MPWNLRRIFRKWSAARIADGTRIYAIGDVHGCISLLEQLLAKADKHMEAFPAHHPILIFLGDYIDRGPASSQVIDHLITLKKYREAIFLMGNHESYMLSFLKKPGLLSKWIQFGGLETLRSYGLSLRDRMDQEEQESVAAALDLVLNERGHRDFLDNLKMSFVCDDFFFVHAGVRPSIPLDQQNEEDLFWIRDDFLHHEGDFGKIIVHGHTPVLDPEVCANRINIDTGAYATGRLTCLVVERDKMKFISTS